MQLPKSTSIRCSHPFTLLQILNPLKKPCPWPNRSPWDSTFDPFFSSPVFHAMQPLTNLSASHSHFLSFHRKPSHSFWFSLTPLSLKHKVRTGGGPGSKCLLVINVWDMSERTTGKDGSNFYTAFILQPPNYPRRSSTPCLKQGHSLKHCSCHPISA